MKDGFNIFNSIDYHINKGFHREVKSPVSYLIKVIGIDCDLRTTCDLKTKICKDQGSMKPNEKYSGIVVMFFLLKTLRRKRFRNELKKKRYGKLEETV